jgi:RimJ/RimL family protein N-acetyltransferase
MAHSDTKHMRELLRTDRLVLRDITEADAEPLFDIDSDPEVMKYIGPRPASEAAPYRQRIRDVYIPFQAHPWHGVRMVLDRISGEILGWIFIRPATAARNARELGWTRDGEEEIGFRFQRSAWGRGIATEAATSLIEIALADPATTAVVACALATNARSLRVLEKLGLERVGEVVVPELSEPLIKLARSNSR